VSICNLFAKAGVDELLIVDPQRQRVDRLALEPSITWADRG
jgi:hypothetical protein